MTSPSPLDRIEAFEIPPLDRVDAIVVRLPFVSPFGTSVATWTCKEAVLLRIEAGGFVGWGECVADPDPYYASETTTAARHILRDFLLPCAARGAPAWSGGMDETGIGRAVNIHLQTVPGFTLPGDTSETRRYFHDDIVEPPVVLGADGFIEVPRGPGIGVTVLEERVAKFRIDGERLR